MSMVVSFCVVLFPTRFVLFSFPRDVLDEILNLIESLSEGFPTYSFVLIIYANYYLYFNGNKQGYYSYSVLTTVC